MSFRQKKKFQDLLAYERGSQRKAWGDRLTICLAYPNVYRTGMSNLGFQTVYRLLNMNPDVVCERVFLPDPEDEPSVSSGSLPILSLESQRPLRDFDIIAFSLSFENDYPHILTLLSLTGLDPLAVNRREYDPLVMAGGIAVTMNPEPLADFFDLFLLGEAEELLSEAIEAMLMWRRTGQKKDECLYRLQSSTEGVYVPRFYAVTYDQGGPIKLFAPIDTAFPKRIRKRWIEDINAFVTDQAIIAPDTELGSMYLTEVNRGCPRGCRFCAAGYIYRPVRFRGWDVLRASVDNGLVQVNRIGLLGTAVSDHPDLIRMCRYILDRQGRVAIGSLRLDRLSDDMIRVLKDGGIQTLSLAPEAGSQRLRDLIRKGITEVQIQKAASALLENGIVNIRTYFMIGLPTETDDDITSLIDLVSALDRLVINIDGREIKFRRITVSINQFIPKAATPLQWCPLKRIDDVKKKIRRIKSAFQKKTAVRVQAESPRYNYIQALLSLGDRRVGQILLAHHRYQGNWPRAFKEAPLHPDFWVYRPKALGEILPWDFIDHGVKRAYLEEEYGKALAGC
ncbi:MAG: hypothetical protein CSYNP_02006 [Syntrophus sp. SKADARSKE-3]|nr:hypothetical protein [Syntrophus sp. SKADARSKE-3]